MEILDLTYKLIALKIKSKTLGRIYFMSQLFQEQSYCYDKRKKYKENENYENLFIFAATPSLSGRGGLLLPPPPPNFLHGKNF